MRAAQNHPALRWTVVVAAALMLHGAALWALQLKLMRQTADVAPAPVAAVIEVVMRRVEPAPERAVEAAPEAHPVKPKAEPKAVHKPVAAAALPHPRVVPVQPLLPSRQLVPIQAATPDATVQPAPEPVSAVPVQAAPSAQASGTPAASAAVADAGGLPGQGQAHVVPPSSDAAYLRNPQPDYPPMSRLRHETGTVMVRV
jgi:protein TonB